MSTNAKHSPLPWYFDRWMIIASTPTSDTPPKLIADIAHDQQGLNRGIETDKANTQFIVRAVNSHQELLEACKAVYEEMGTRLSYAEFELFSEATKDKLQKAIRKATVESEGDK